jgi:hypothetical protein
VWNQGRRRSFVGRRRGEDEVDAALVGHHEGGKDGRGGEKKERRRRKRTKKGEEGRIRNQWAQSAGMVCLFQKKKRRKEKREKEKG